MDLHVLFLSSWSTQDKLFSFTNFIRYYSNMKCSYLYLIQFKQNRKEAIAWDKTDASPSFSSVMAVVILIGYSQVPSHLYQHLLLVF